MFAQPYTQPARGNKFPLLVFESPPKEASPKKSPRLVILISFLRQSRPHTALSTPHNNTSLARQSITGLSGSRGRKKLPDGKVNGINIDLIRPGFGDIPNISNSFKITPTVYAPPAAELLTMKAACINTRDEDADIVDFNFLIRRATSSIGFSSQKPYHKRAR